MKVDLLAYTPEPEKVIAMAAKLCYSPVGVSELKEDLTEEKVQKFVNHLMSLGHESPIEHVSFTFGIEGISRTCSHQFVRHRIASFSQQSQRYVKLDQFEYIIPPMIEQTPLAKDIFLRAMERDQKYYDELTMILIHKYIKTDHIDKMQEVIKEVHGDVYSEMAVDYWNVPSCGDNARKYAAKFKEMYPKIYGAIEKKAIEDARYVFPNACETKMVVTMNLRALLNFCHHRCCNRAQWEIREVAWEIVKRIEEVSPLLASCLGASCQFGKCPEGTMCCGNPYESKVK